MPASAHTYIERRDEVVPHPELFQFAQSRQARATGNAVAGEIKGVQVLEIL